jgi:GT2 family glycosyltransferase
MTSPVTVSIVNYNHAAYLPACVKALWDQTAPPERIVVVDNASTDASAEVLEGLGADVGVMRNPINRGYAGGHNQVLRTVETPYVLALNCDVILERDFLSRCVEVMEEAPVCGSVSGRLYRGSPPDMTPLDTTGLFPDRLRRFHDRRNIGHEASSRATPIFGPSGSAALYRMRMLEDVRYRDEYFDEDFFAYCEDADLAWRAQRMGWTSLLAPAATGWHVHEDLSRARSDRRDADANRRQLLLIRNRHLCLLKNDELAELARDLPWVLGYDLALEAYLLLRKPRLALQWPLAVISILPRTWAKRGHLAQRQRARVRLSDWLLSRWGRPNGSIASSRQLRHSER